MTVLRKFTRTDESAQVLSPEAHKAVEVELKKLGKTSARELSDSELESLRDAVDNPNSR